MEVLFESPIAWLVVAFLVFSLALRATPAKGVLGERKVKASIDRGLNKNVYRSVHDLTLPTKDGTTQVDHVVVSKYGVFIIETKNLTGWIFGDPQSKKWTQSIYGKNYRFQNPLHQNYKHLKAVEALLQLDPECLYSVVVFVGESEFKTEMPPNVMGRRALTSYVRSKTNVYLSDAVVERSVATLLVFQGRRSTLARGHLRNLYRNHKHPLCPRCGNAMVLRTAKRGPKSGGRFWGCPEYPKCTATKDAA